MICIICIGTQTETDIKVKYKDVKAGINIISKMERIKQYMYNIKLPMSLEIIFNSITQNIINPYKMSNSIVRSINYNIILLPKSKKIVSFHQNFTYYHKILTQILEKMSTLVQLYVREGNRILKHKYNSLELVGKIFVYLLSIGIFSKLISNHKFVYITIKTYINGLQLLFGRFFSITY